MTQVAHYPTQAGADDQQVRAPLQRMARRVGVAAGAAGAAVLGVAPHVLHHVGPLAGAALFAGAGGTALFGAIGFVLAVPTLLKLHRHTGGWGAPAGALALMAVAFSVSAFVIGPAISGSDDEAAQPPAPGQTVPASGHSAHHQ
jgi:hypothetical protein